MPWSLSLCVATEAVAKAPPRRLDDEGPAIPVGTRFCAKKGLGAGGTESFGFGVGADSGDSCIKLR
jgi:hypothetical protein